MHSHQGMQEQSLMTAPLIVRSAEDMRAERQEVVLMLHDFSFRTPEELLAGLTKSNGSQSAMPKGGMGDSMKMGSGSMAAMNMGSGMAMDLNDVDFDAFLANDRTLADPEVIRTEPGGRVRLRLINAASSTQFWIDLGPLTGTVVAVDGHPVRPVRGTRLPLAMAQRIDVLIDLPANGPYPIVAQVEGKRARTGIVLAASGAPVSRLAEEVGENAPPVDLSLERRLEAITPLAPRAPGVTHRVILAGAMVPYAWSLNGEYWPNVTPLMVDTGQRVAIEMVNHSMMAHPMHLHGHAFQVVAINGAPLAGAMRDTVLVPPMGSVIIAFDADNPGRPGRSRHPGEHGCAGLGRQRDLAGAGRSHADGGISACLFRTAQRALHPDLLHAGRTDLARRRFRIPLQGRRGAQAVLGQGLRLGLLHRDILARRRAGRLHQRLQGDWGLLRRRQFRLAESIQSLHRRRPHRGLCAARLHLAHHENRRRTPAPA
jgi:hypothetical protein